MEIWLTLAVLFVCLLVVLLPVAFCMALVETIMDWKKR